MKLLVRQTAIQACMLSANHLLVLQHVFLQPELTRAGLGDLTGFSPATIARLVSDLRDRDFLVETRISDTHIGRGRPSASLRVTPGIGYVVGAEFGHEHATVCIVDATGSIVFHESGQGPFIEPTNSAMNELARIVMETVEKADLPWRKVRAVSVALHGVVSAQGDWLSWSNVSYPAKRYLAQRLDKLVYVEDISRAFAEAEHRFGAGRDTLDMIYVFIGRRGVGAGIFVNGVLLKSSLGVCGEIGHIVVDQNGALCQCGNRGCLETVATHDAVVGRLRTRLKKGVMSTLTDSDDLSFARVCEAARNGDKEAHIALSELAHYQAQALASAVNVVGATLVLVGGQLRFAGDGFLTDLKSGLQQQLLPPLAQRLEVKYAVLPTYAGAWGAAAQALDATWADGSFIQEN
jgi:predicted NBD/HSP70 family sugar kinase